MRSVQEFYNDVVTAILFDYCRFYMSGEYKDLFDDEKGNKCKDAVEVLCTTWFDFDFQDTTKEKEFSELMSSLDYSITNKIVKEELQWIYVYVKTTNSSHPEDILAYKKVAKAVKTLLKLDFQMSKEEIKALVK